MTEDEITKTVDELFGEVEDPRITARDQELKNGAERWKLRTIALSFIDKFGDMFMKWDVKQVQKDIGAELAKLFKPEKHE